MIEQFDLFIIEIINRIHHPFLDQLMRFITSLGDLAIIWLLFALFFLCIKKNLKQSLLVILTVIITFLINDLFLKNLIQRPRPFISYPEYPALISPPHSYSCPSGHSATSFAAFSSIHGYRLIKGIACLFAILISFSRIYLGVHYPSDILAGILLGVMLSYLIAFLVKKAKL